MAQDILITPGSGEPQILFRGSGAIDTAVELNVLSSYQSGTGSGTAILFEGTEGQLFGITDNLSSGTIFSVADITGLPIIEADASGDVKLGEYGRYVGIGTGVPAYGLDVFSSGILRKGVILSNYVPATTTNALYNEGGTLKFNGSAVGGGGTSAEATYASGQAISNQSNITALLTASGTATSLISTSGIATYASGQAVANQSSATTNASNISTNTGNISTNTARVSYASGQAISNQSNITALNTASGVATSLLATSGTTTSLVATSGIASYASGNTANISFGSNAEGDLLYHNGTSFIRLAKGTDDYILKMNGNVPNWEAESGGSSLTAGSGVVVDGANKINIHGGTGNLQEIQLTSDNIFTPKMIFTGSGVQDTPVTMKVLSSFGSVSTSGTALSFEGTQGQLFGITDNLSSGNIFSVNDITGLPLISASASGDVKLAEYGRYILSYGGYVQESVPASDTPTTEDATVTLDLSAGNYHNVILGANVTKFEFTNAKRGQRFLLRVTQHASSAKTIAWTNVDYTTGGAAATVRWAGGGTAPTMSTSTSHTDVYGFLCTNNAGSAFDGFVVGQNLPD